MNHDYNFELSICFCAWNEEANISDCITDALAAAESFSVPGQRFEVVVIDNASTDSTPHVVREWERMDSRVRLIRHPENRLYSGSHRTAFKEAKGKFIAILDGDRQHTAKDVERALAMMNKTGCEVVFGWKKKRYDGPLRQIFSVGLRVVSQFIVGHRLHDINCGFRVFQQSAAQQIQIEEKMNSVGPEIYCECRRLNFKIGEMTVQHFARAKGEGLHDRIGPLLKNTRRFLAYLMRLRRRYGATSRLPVEAM